MSRPEALRYEEYFICCNPPLTPRGVGEVVTKSRDHLDGLLEILYEPGGPWFKLISDKAARLDITYFIEDLVADIAQNEVNIATVDPKSVQGSPLQQSRKRSDVEIMADAPRMLPWSTYKNSPPDIQLYEAFTWPEEISTAPYRLIWRKLEQYPQLNHLDELLAKAAETWMALEVPRNLEDAEESLGCNAVWNLKNTVLYMSSYDSMDAVTNAAEKLDLVLKVLFSDESYPFTRHVIIADGAPKLGYRWISHMGLAGRIHHSLDREVPIDITKTVVLRTAEETEKDHWVIDKTSYPHPRNPNAVSSRQSIVASVRHRGQVDPVIKTWAENVSRATARLHQKAPSIHSNMDEGQASEYVTSHASEKSNMELQVPNTLIEADVFAGIEQDVCRGVSSPDLLDTLSPRDGGALSRYVVMDPGQGVSSEASEVGPSSEESDLIDFSNESDTVEFETRSASPRGKHVTKAPIETVDDATEHPAIFGIEELPPKDVRRTMGQRAGSKTINPTKKTKKNAPSESTQNRAHNAGDRNSGKVMNWSGLFKGGGTSSPGTRPCRDTLQSDPKGPGASPGPPADPSSPPQAISGSLAAMLETLRVVPGKVSLELKLGLIYVQNLSECNVTTNGTSPLWGLQTIEEALNVAIGKDGIGFEDILSSRGEDANALARMPSHGDFGWETPEVTAHYEITFRRPTRFRVVVNATSFEHECLGLGEEVSSIYVHCPRHVMDMVFCASRASLSSLPAECRKISKDLVSSLSISTDDAGDITVEATLSRALATAIESAEIVHLARYRSKRHKDCFLNIKMTHPLAQALNIRGEAATFRWKTYAVGSFDKVKGSQTRPQEYFRASLSSCHAEKAFQNNAKLEFGRKVDWKTNDVQRESSFQELYMIGIKMVSEMDNIGMTNETGIAPKARTQGHGQSCAPNYWPGSAVF
ncbi:hypothetical protein GMORB2_5800 [Geosmithia morbida]|uniref:Uncharacterized protein n=1 Tax=Geosmithia morbida TaxID=1094350 RepID=A0A9P5D716_9HYPO|nr:uncharacterized protein GMORB2_5800 [Geosmithia morbida]KAF4124084.1 hypothetical protein GMORB2_5800 [Geosmithia morbida]